MMPTNATPHLQRSLYCLLVIQCLLSPTINAEKTSNSQEIEGQDGYYTDETPQDWVDYAFAVWMVLHHLYYAYKFTDYSLSHIHTVSDKKKDNAQQKQENDGSAKKKKKPSKNTKQPSQKEIAAENKRREKKAKAKAEKAIKEVAKSSNFTTKSSPFDLSKPVRRAKSVCCCIRCAPRCFTWQRTVVVRLMLRIYTALSCLLAFVLAAEFFMNVFVEFFITCVVHYAQGWVAALLMLPLIIYVIETMLRISWHSCVIAWQLNCDANGDIEASNSEGGQHFNLQANQFLFSYREDDDDVEEQYNSSDLSSSESSVTSSSDAGGDGLDEDAGVWSSDADTDKELNVGNRPTWLNIPSITAQNLDTNNSGAMNSPYTPNTPTDLEVIEESDDLESRVNAQRMKPKVNTRHLKHSKSDADQVDTSKIGLKLKDVKSADNSRGITLKQQPKKPRSMTEDISSQQRTHSNNGGMESDEQKELEPSRSADRRKLQKEERRKLRQQQKAELKKNLQKQKEEARQRRKELLKKQREEMGDFFLATCWRAWFCVGTLMAAVVASYTLHVEIGTNGLFWQLLMRYCVIGGLIWNVVYGILSFVLCVMARLVSWSLLHPNITRCKFLCLIDAKDHEKRNKGWRNCKVLVMSLSLVLFTVCVAFGVYLTRAGNDAAGFLIFMGLVWLSYYVTNLAMSCKPMALVALWTDTIPPPGKNFIAHLRVSAALQDAGELDNILQVNQQDRYSVATNTELELGRFNSAVSGHESNNKDKHVYRAVALGNTSHNNTERTDEEPSSMKRHKNTLTEHEVDEISTATGISAYAPSSRASALHRTKSAVLFAAERMAALIKRYKKFVYVYKDAEMIAQQRGVYTGCCSLTLQWYKLRFFWNNYKNYWLNVYRPFDEYDMDTNLASTRILMGFQWFKPCTECTCTRRRKHISCKKRVTKCCQYTMDNTCNLMLVIFFGALIANLFFFATKFNDVASVTSSLEATTVITEDSSNVTQYYPVCSDLFGAENNDLLNMSAPDQGRLRSDSDLSVLDALFLAQVVYEMDNFRIDEMIASYFDDEYQVLLAQFEVPYHLHITHKTEEIDFVAIRGTASLEEALQDLSLFVEVALFEGLQWVVPFLNALPTTFVTSLIYYSSLTEQLLNAGVRDQFDEQIYDYLTDYLSNTTTSLHLIGHSLGGAIAAIVGANLFEDGYDSYIASLGVCSPGLLYSSAKFGFGISALDKTSRSVLPRRDLVSAIDIHGGSVQDIDCNENSMFSCHVTPSVICELYRNCPWQLAKKPALFDCYCNNQDLHEEKGRQQFGDCMNVTECDGSSCFV